VKVRIKLFGTLCLREPGYDSAKGMELEMPEGSEVRDLLRRLGISAKQDAMVIIAGRSRKKNYRLHEREEVNVFDLAIGG
jgi:sulfur carrier protein ThiS